MGNIIYALVHPNTAKVVYIGKSVVGINRPLTLLKEKSHSESVNKWVNALRLADMEPVIIILEHNVDDIILDLKERFWIEYYSDEDSALLNKNKKYLSKEPFEPIDDSSPLYAVGVYVRARRKILGLTQPELAEKAGVGLRFLRKLEQGRKTNFNTDSINKVLRCIGRFKLGLVDADELSNG